MKIMHIAEPFATGVLSFLVDITQKQVEEHEVYILWGMRPLTPQNVETLFDSRVHLIKIGDFKGAIGTVINPKAYREVRKWYYKIKPDIVHMHSSASGFVGRWALPVGEIPSFYTPHGYSFLMKDGGWMKRMLFWGIEWLSAKRPCQTIACSEGEWQEAKKLDKKAVYVNNGINLEMLQPYIQDFSPVDGKVRICTSGRILAQKNPQMFNEIANEMPEVEFVWIGEGELRSELKAPNISITGWIERGKALEILRDCDFFILPSLWEGLPLSLLEAMAMKKVCLVSDVIGNRDVIRTGENGFICHSAKEYANRIYEIMADKQYGIRISEKAAKDVEMNYNLQTMAAKYQAIYTNAR